MRQTPFGGEGFALTNGGGVSADTGGGKNVDGLGNFGKLCARLPWSTKVCGTAGKTQNFQRTPKRMLWLHAGIGSQNVKRTESATLPAAAAPAAAAAGRWEGPGGWGEGSSGSSSCSLGPCLQRCAGEGVLRSSGGAKPLWGVPFTSSETTQSVNKTGREWFCNPQLLNTQGGIYLITKKSSFPL